MTELTRSALLSGAPMAGGAIATGGFVAAHVARAADSDEDLAWVRLGINLEFLKTVFYKRALRSGFFAPGEARSLTRGEAADQAHLDRLVETLTSQGRTSIDGQRPRGRLPGQGVRQPRQHRGARQPARGSSACAPTSAHLRVWRRPPCGSLFAQVAANEGEQLSFFQGVRGPAIGPAFPYGYDIARAADELAVYLP